MKSNADKSKKPTFKEIGSNYWLSPEQLQVREKAEPGTRFIKKGEDFIFTSSGRGAISLVLENIDPARRTALLPLYTCESVIMPFEKKGFRAAFYRQKTDLGNKIDDFMNAIETHRPGVVLFHAYFGFDTLHDLRPLYSQLRRQGIVVIEDITHSLFSEFAREGADYYVASLRKWFALPDGGVAISTGAKLAAAPARIHDELVAVNVKAIRMKHEYTLTMSAGLKDEYRKLFYSTEAMLNEDCGVYAMSGLSRAILSATGIPPLIASRRANFRYLLEALKNSKSLVPVFSGLPDGVAPLYLPVYVSGERAKLRAFLAANEIYAPVHWEIPSPCAPQLDEEVRHIYEHILSIPCDQRYGEKDMERIVQTLSRYVN